MPSTSLIFKFALTAAALVQPALALPQSSSNLPTSATLATFSRSSSRSATTVRPTASSTAPARNSTGFVTSSNACGAIALAEAAFVLLNPDADVKDFGNNEVVPVELAAACLQSVPLNKTAAVDFINWYKSYLQFQTTLEWLKHPPPSYQQSAVDLIGGLDLIASKVSGDKYKGEYEFEVAISNLLQSAHDGHLDVALPMLNVFEFKSPLTFVSLSSDGSSLPGLFVNNDIRQANNATSKISWTPSSVTTINGQKAVDFLTTYAKNFAGGSVDPQTDWNNLFENAARTNAKNFPAFGVSTKVPADFNVRLTFANGSSASREWVAFTATDLRGVETPQDFYDLVVAPDYTEESGSSDDTPDPAPAKQVTTWGAPYPTPVIAQRNLTVGGYFTGYFLNASSTAVMSLPSFDFSAPGSLKGFQDAVASFLVRCKQANMKKLVIDLQGNGGGIVDSGFDLFKQLFPTIEPFGGSQLRVTKAVDFLGTTVGNNLINNIDKAAIVDNEYSFQSVLDINNKPFTSWPAMAGPLNQGGDQFTNLLRTKLSSGTSNASFSVSGYDSRTNLPSQVFFAQDIVLLTDGSCGSTCTIFAEEMHTQAGIKNVVVGGRPELGPMQGVAGVRGSQVLTVADYALYFNYTTNFNHSVSASLLPSLDIPPIQIKDVKNVRFNIRNQLRKSKPDVPLQFIYQAADCKIWYTQAMLKNYEVLWQTAADAIWKNLGLCVQGSTGHQSAQPGVTTVTAVPKYSSGNGTNATAPVVPYTTTGAAGGRSQFMGLSMAASAGVFAIAVSLL